MTQSATYCATKTLGKNDAIGDVLRAITAATPLIVLFTILFSFKISGFILTLLVLSSILLFLLAGACFYVAFNPRTPDIIAKRAGIRLIVMMGLSVFMGFLIFGDIKDLPQAYRYFAIFEQRVRLFFDGEAFDSAVLLIPSVDKLHSIATGDEFIRYSDMLNPLESGLDLHSFGKDTTNDIKVASSTSFLAALSKIDKFVISRGQTIDLQSLGGEAKLSLLMAKNIVFEPNSVLRIGKHNVVLAALSFEFEDNSRIESFNARDDSERTSGHPGDDAGSLYLIVLKELNGSPVVALSGQDGAGGSPGSDGLDGRGFIDEAGNLLNEDAPQLRRAGILAHLIHDGVVGWLASVA